jgi:hypothetical protein
MMKAANDNKLPHGATLDGLPLFATDMQIAVAIVGKDRASYWLKTVLPTLKGFPRKDEAHAGWPVPLVRKFYDGYLGVIYDFASKGASGAENLDVWKKKKRA